MKSNVPPIKSESVASLKSRAFSLKQAIGYFFLAIAIGLCLWTGQDLAPGSLCSRNLLLLIIGFKILTWCDLPTMHPSYFFWIGMNPYEFSFATPPAPAKQTQELIKSLVEISIGFLLIVVIQRFDGQLPLALMGILKLLSITILIYFGAFRLLAYFFQRSGRGVRALMNDPYKLRTLPEFWSKRWNRAFPYIMCTYIYGPVKKKTNSTIALISAFTVSGFLHELLTSVPAKAGYGLPTLYFVIQAIGIGLIRSQVGKRLGLSKGLVGKIFALAWLALPLPLLFHGAFMDAVVLKMYSS